MKKSKKKFEDIAIIGLGAMFPQSKNTEEFWSHIKNGDNLITEIPATHWSPEEFYDADPKKPDHTYAKVGGFLSPYKFNPLEFGISPNAIEATDTTQLLGMVVAQKAMEDAGYGVKDDFDRDRVSCIIGVTGTLELVIPLGARLGHPIWRKALKNAGVDKEVADDVVERISESYVGWQESSFPGLLGNVVAGRVANHLNLGGTNCVVDAACGSSLAALHTSVLELQAGTSDMVITGGFDTFNDIFMYMCFSKTPALSKSGVSRPFDANGDGTTLGEGLGVVILKRLSDAERDNDKVYAVIKGVGTSSDGKGQAIYAPSSKGQAKALRAAYAQANLDPKTVDLLEAHGTGTKVGDAQEINGLTSVFPSEEGTLQCAVGSVKSQIGHTKAAAGIAGLIKATMALHNKVIPPTIKINTPAEPIKKSSFYTTEDARPWVSPKKHPRRAGVSAFGFGGSNFHCVLEEYSSEKSKPDWDGNIQLLPFSARNEEGLKDLLEKEDWSGLGWDEVRDFAQELRESYEPQDVRLILIADKNSSLKDLVNQVISRLGSSSEGSWNIKSKCYFSKVKLDGKIAFIYPGQGSQSPQMLQELACLFPEMLDGIEKTELSWSKHSSKGDKPLADMVFPPSAYSDEEKETQVSDLTRTDRTQPALGAVSFGVHRVLSRFGLKPDMVAGHSYGELVALNAAGVLEDKDFFDLSCLRGKYMNASSDGDKGSMLAVISSKDIVEKAIKAEGWGLVVANHNAQDQVVVSGATDEIMDALDYFKSVKIRAVRLNVGAAFHSKLVSKAKDQFLKSMEKIKFAKAKIPVYSNRSAAVYPQTEKPKKEALANQLASSVRFVDMIQNMHKSGARLFVEVGPGRVLGRLVSKILKDKADTSVISLSAGHAQKSDVAGLANALAEMLSMGVDMDLSKWDENHVVTPKDKKKGFFVEICGANYVKEKKMKPPVSPKKKAVVRETIAAKPAPRPVKTEPLFKTESQSKPVQNIVNVNQQKTMNINIHNKARVPTMTSSSHDNDKKTKSVVSHSSIDLAQQNLIALQNLQKQNAEIHTRFLEGQKNSQEMFFQLMQQQMNMLSNPGVTMQPVQTFQQIKAPVETVYNAQPEPAKVMAEPVASVMSQPVAPAMKQEAPVVKKAVVQEKVAPVAKPASVASGLDYKTTLLEVVSEKTGYPVDMLDLTMDLEADLGVDSIKRVEIFSVLTEKLSGLEGFESDQIGSYHTLQNVLDAISGPVIENTAAATLGETPVTTGGDTVNALLGVIAEKTGYPMDMLATDMELESDLGIDSIKRVEIFSALQDVLPEAGNIPSEKMTSLHTIQDILAELSASSEAAAITPVVEAPKEAGSDVKAALLSVVSEKTGYPEDMLEMSMELETDLGVDSIKRVEIFSALQDKLPNSNIGEESVASYLSLQQIMDALQPVKSEVAGAKKKVRSPRTASIGL